MTFEQLNIEASVIRALREQGYTEPTEIQAEAIPKILRGMDLLGCAQTGTGKTAAFAAPTLQLLGRERGPSGKKRIRALVVTPTRELALQIYESFRAYGRYTRQRACVIFGGVSQKPQETELKKGVDILVATPGRLNDLISQKIVDISGVEILVLDEADRMLDMGFLNDVKKIIAKVPAKRQTLLFSATMPKDIAEMADSILTNPAKVSVTPVSSTVDAIEQKVYFVDKENKKNLLLRLLQNREITSALIFTKTKHKADGVVRFLTKANIPAQAIHGNKSQSARQQALANFKARKIRVLVATDIAARGIDITELSHVINYELPDVPETYVHRIGRTGRAGLGGVAVSFCDYDEKPLLAAIVKLTGKPVAPAEGNPFPLVNTFPAEKKAQPSGARPKAAKNAHITPRPGAGPSRRASGQRGRPASSGRNRRGTGQAGGRNSSP